MTCKPTRIYGPLQHYLFCGCSIINWTVNGGKNEQPSTLTVQLVQDPCSGMKFWFDENLIRRSGVISDPGFTYPDPGCAAYFRIDEQPSGNTELERGGFEFCGLIQNWTEKFDSNGNPTYTITVSDPRSLLDDVQVITKDDAEPTSGVWNVINVYGFVNSLGSKCSGSISGFGGITDDNVSGFIPNDNGIVWNDVKCAIHTLTSSVNPDSGITLFLRDGRLANSGPNEFKNQQGYGVIKADNFVPGITNPNINPFLHYFTVDLSEIPFGSEQYRINGSITSLLSLISDVCEKAACDYYIELLPTNVNNRIEKVIKVRTISRLNQPQLGQINNFISQRSGDGTLISYTFGQESRSDPTSFYLLGGQKKIPYFFDSGHIVPFWGLDNSGNLNPARIESGEYIVTLDVSSLNNHLLVPFTGTKVEINEREIRAALYDIDSWKIITLHLGRDIKTHLSGQLNMRLPIDPNDIPDIFSGVKDDVDLVVPQISTNTDDNRGDKIKHNELNSIYNFIRSYAQEHYGRKFIAYTSGISGTYDIERKTTEYPIVPSKDGCWISQQYTGIFGLSLTGTQSNTFRQEDGKYLGIAVYDFKTGVADTTKQNPKHIAFDSGGIPNFTKVSQDKYVATSGRAWLAIDVEEKVYSGTPIHPDSGHLTSFVFTLPGLVLEDKSQNSELSEEFAGADEIAKTLNKKLKNPNIVNTSTLMIGSYQRALLPSGIMIPVVHKKDRYGPWGKVGLPWKTEFDVDEGLVPWEYGSESLLDLAATSIVNDAVSYMRYGERGSITLAGIPNIPLGAELFAADSSDSITVLSYQKYYHSRIYQLTNCAKSYQYIHVPMTQWKGVYGPTIDGINVQMAQQGFTTTYSLSTFTPTYGKLGRTQAKILRRLAKLKDRVVKQLNKLNKDKVELQRKRNFVKELYESKLNKSHTNEKSPYRILICDNYDTGNSYYTVNLVGLNELQNAALSGKNPYFTTLDGLITRDVGSLDNTSYYDTTFKQHIDSTYWGVPIFTFQGKDINYKTLNKFAGKDSFNVTGLSLSQMNIRSVGISGSSYTGLYDVASIAPHTGYKPLVLRGPLIMRGYGIDESGFPSPSYRPSPSSTTTPTGCFPVPIKPSYKFVPYVYNEGPVDLRWDPYRNVWCFPRLELLLKFTAVPQGYQNTFSSTPSFPTGATFNTPFICYTPYEDIYFPSTITNVYGLYLGKIDDSPSAVILNPDRLDVDFKYSSGANPLNGRIYDISIMKSGACEFMPLLQKLVNSGELLTLPDNQFLPPIGTPAIPLWEYTGEISVGHRCDPTITGLSGSYCSGQEVRGYISGYISNSALGLPYRTLPCKPNESKILLGLADYVGGLVVFDNIECPKCVSGYCGGG